MHRERVVYVRAVERGGEGLERATGRKGGGLGVVSVITFAE